MNESRALPGTHYFGRLQWDMSRLHPFYDGNKRTAFAAMILRIYRFWIGKQDEEVIHRVLHKISNVVRVRC
ncbi:MULTISPECIES: Fic family protein [Methanothrix]|uniref:Fic family protein n=1 Tax=Methanothrix TaxID=2222 RepID=UPI00373AE159